MAAVIAVNIERNQIRIYIRDKQFDDRFSAVQVQIPASYFIDIDAIILKFIWRGRRPRRAHAILKKNKTERLTLLD